MDTKVKETYCIAFGYIVPIFPATYLEALWKNTLGFQIINKNKSTNDRPNQSHQL